MSRTIEFDTNEIIKSTMQTFWSNGLKTTLKDIEASTGLSKSSIYNTFGNKEKLLGLALMCYVEQLEEWINNSFDKLTFKEFLKLILEDAATDNFNGRGCFFCNCLGNKDALSQKNKKILDSAYLQVRNIFESRILLAKERNELNLNFHVTGYATLLMTTVAGLRAFNISGLPKDDLRNAALAAFERLA